ncbi:MAG: class I SAM-dependent methyltransferase [archaeon]|nr:class I SAM-dependent methyltransferase [archaeon]
MGSIGRIRKFIGGAIAKAARQRRETHLYGKTYNYPPKVILRDLRLSENSLRGKKILHLGEGDGSFGEYCKSLGAEYVGLDAKKGLKRARGGIVAEAENIPLSAQTVDLVIDHYGPLFNAQNKIFIEKNSHYLANAEQIIREALRAGKTFFAYPVKPIFMELLLENSGLKTNFLFSYDRKKETLRVEAKAQ